MDDIRIYILMYSELIQSQFKGRDALPYADFLLTQIYKHLSNDDLQNTGTNNTQSSSKGGFERHEPNTFRLEDTITSSSLTTIMPNKLIAPPEWIPDHIVNNCMICSVQFSFFTR